MAKLPAKKPKLTPEEQLAELAALTGDVAAINLMHPNAPIPQPTAALAADSPSEPASPTPLASPVIAPTASAPTIADRGGEGEPAQKSALTKAAKPAPAPQPAVAEPALAPLPTATVPIATATDEDDELAEEPTAPVAAPPRPTEAGYSLDALFKPSKEKKTVMMRITPTLHQYLQQVGVLLGEGTSVPDVVHNILLEWKALHGPEVQKALQKQMRILLKNASS